MGALVSISNMLSLFINLAYLNTSGKEAKPSDRPVNRKGQMNEAMPTGRA